jgi:hypothetical protein
MVQIICFHLFAVEENNERYYKSDHGFLDQENRSRHLEKRQNLTPESVLEEIWYWSQELHLFGAPIHIFKS